ncbi:MAG TPA: HEPN domain-containing protein [Candidatus Nitrosotalea sp.]|nr:HEPN domain-containing protein [Candidatus Nitrosotalea sp.]
MNPNKKYLKWCAKQKNGIKIIAGSITLQKAYLQKSKNAIKSMEVNAKAGINDWAVAASYYARYDAVYALFSRIGIKCEIHDCTIALFKYLFLGKIAPELIHDLEQSKNDRIDAQYYTRTTQINQNKVITDTKNFVLEIEQIIANLTKSEIAALQATLKSAL